jgi:hypothetical protein
MISLFLPIFLKHYFSHYVVTYKTQQSRNIYKDGFYWDFMSLTSKLRKTIGTVLVAKAFLNVNLADGPYTERDCRDDVSISRAVMGVYGPSFNGLDCDNDELVVPDNRLPEWQKSYLKNLSDRTRKALAFGSPAEVAFGVGLLTAPYWFKKKEVKQEGEIKWQIH